MLQRRRNAPVHPETHGLPFPASPREQTDVCASSVQAEPLRNLTNYIQEQWIEGTIFTPKDWSVFKQPTVQTNNDIVRGGTTLWTAKPVANADYSFTSVIELLYREARLTSITIKLVSDKKLKRIQRRKYRQLQQKLLMWRLAWRHKTGNKNASQLLRCCSLLNGPARSQ